MSFRDIPNVEDYDHYLQVALNRAKKAADSYRSSLKLDPLKKSQTIEIERIKTFSIAITHSLNTIVKAYPSYESLTPFYKELIQTTLDVRDMRKSLADLNYAGNKIQEMSQNSIAKIKFARNVGDVNKHRKELIGRASNTLKKMKSSFAYLEQCRKQFVRYPVIKSMYTVAIAGFPNVGKSTLLKKMTGSPVEIKDYAFTTRQLLIGYAQAGYDKMQFIDTPGTLNRPDKMNAIEQQAYLAMKLAADAIVFVFDPVTEQYSFDDQVKLFKRVVKYDKPVITYLSKTDIAKPEQIALFSRFKCLTDPESVIKELEKASKSA